MSREVKRWITVNGNHIPIYEGESNYDALDRFYCERKQKKSVKVGDNDVNVSTRKKRVDQEDLTEERIMDEIAGKDSYTKDTDYIIGQSIARKGHEQLEQIQSRMKELNEELEGEMSDKPEEEWDANDELSAMFFSDKPKKYTDRGKEINEELASLREQKADAERRWQHGQSIMEDIDKKVAPGQREKWLKESNEWVSDKVQEDYFGFATRETTTPYVDEALEKGTAVVMEMSPKRYIEECAYNIFGKRKEGSTLETTLHGRSAKDIAKYMTMMEEGVKFNTPYLNYRDNEQEGLHRAIAAYMLGIERMPVVVIKRRK